MYIHAYVCAKALFRTRQQNNNKKTFGKSIKSETTIFCCFLRSDNFLLLKVDALFHVPVLCTYVQTKVHFSSSSKFLAGDLGVNFYQCTFLPKSQKNIFRTISCSKIWTKMSCMLRLHAWPKNR
jgi:hypothetical protein